MFEASNLGSFAAAETDTNGHVPEADYGPWNLSHDVFSIDPKWGRVECFRGTKGTYADLARQAEELGIAVEERSGDLWFRDVKVGRIQGSEEAEVIYLGRE